MIKRLLAIICLLSVCVGCICFGMTANATTERYQVGYAICDINPWIDPEDHSKGLLPLKLTGNGNDDERVCTGIMDDNDDGVVGDGDGLFTTATAVTDPYGKTIIYITIDALQGYGNITKAARAEIVSALGKSVITGDQIMVNANHSHSAPNFSSDSTYYNYVLTQITNAAIEAYNDRAEAVMTKGSVDALESTAYLGYNGGNGYYMNAIRHYDVTSQRSIGPIVITKQHVAGSSFGSMSAMSGYKETSRVNNMESDNTMHVLLFSFPNNTEKEPVVFVNWRAHSTTNSGGDNKTLVSSDFANSVRANLKKAGYRAAFMQGASGNVSTKSSQLDDWTAECGNVADANVYGRILANIALDCIARNMTTELSAGNIRTLQKLYHGEIQQDSEGLQAAAQEAAAASNVEYPYSYKHTDGKTYILNSRFHTNAIINRSKAADSYTDLELNVILLGNNVAFVTAPGELADRYDLAGSTEDEDNDWLELINEATYGTPFVLGYTNEGKGYIPFSLEYTYNTYEYYTITGKGLNGNEFHGAGSYEANTSRLARGTGEDIIQTFKQMLSEVDEMYYVAMCEACKQEVEWKPIGGVFTDDLKLPSGHYYICNDLPSCRVNLSSGDVLCFDLNGYTIEDEGRCFALPSGSTLNLFDSAGTGTAISYTGGSNVSGGTVTVQAGATFNIYGGTLRFVQKTVGTNVYETGRGAVISCDGTTNMYGGKLIGGTLVKSSYWSSTDRSNGCGGTVYVSGTFNAYGGRIISGKAAEGALGDCVYLASTAARFTLSGSAVIDEIFIYDNTGKQITVIDKFSGRAALSFNPAKDTLELGTDVGDHVEGSFTSANLYTTSHPEFSIGIVGEHLKLIEREETPEPQITVGDLDDIEGVNEDDAIYLLQHVLMPEFFPVTQNVDFDNSGNVDEDDAVYLLQHVLMPEEFPL